MPAYKTSRSEVRYCLLTLLHGDNKFIVGLGTRRDVQELAVLPLHQEGGGGAKWVGEGLPGRVCGIYLIGDFMGVRVESGDGTCAYGEHPLVPANAPGKGPK